MQHEKADRQNKIKMMNKELQFQMDTRKKDRDLEQYLNKLPQKTTLPGPESPGPDLEKEWYTEKRDINKNNLEQQI